MTDRIPKRDGTKHDGTCCANGAGIPNCYDQMSYPNTKSRVRLDAGALIGTLLVAWEGVPNDERPEKLERPFGAIYKAIGDGTFYAIDAKSGIGDDMACTPDSQYGKIARRALVDTLMESGFVKLGDIQIESDFNPNSGVLRFVLTENDDEKFFLDAEDAIDALIAVKPEK